MNKKELINFYRYIRLVSDSKKEIELGNFMIQNLKKGITPMPSK